MNNFKLKIDKLLVALSIIFCMMLSLYPVNAPIKKALNASSETVVAEAASAFGGYYDGLNTNLSGSSFRAELADLITDTHKTQTTYSGL